MLSTVDIHHIHCVDIPCNSADTLSALLTLNNRYILTTHPADKSLTHPIDLLPSLIPPLDLLQPLAHAYSEEAAAVIAKELYD